MDSAAKSSRLRAACFYSRLSLIAAIVALTSCYFVSPHSVSAQMPGAEQGGGDPIQIYREAGVDANQEQEIRRLAKEFEDLNKVRYKLMINLLKEMKGYSLQPEPNEKQVLAKQDEINTLQAEMATERIKLMLKIRQVLTTDQKERLVGLMRQPRTPQMVGQP